MREGADAKSVKLEGLRDRRIPVLSPQHHPEGCPGPLGTEVLFDRYKAWVRKGGGAAPTESADAGFRTVKAV